MRRDRLTFPNFLISFLLAGLIGFSCMMCLQDAFDLVCRPGMLLVVCGIGALLASLSLCVGGNRMVFAAAGIGYVLLLVWQWTALVSGAEYVLYRITSEYASCFQGIPILGQPEGSAFLPLSALALPLVWVTARVIGRDGGTAFIVVFCIPVLILCLVIVDLAPVLWLVILVGCLLILVVSHSVRERNPADGGRLAWWLVLPTIILISGITVLWPPADYMRADWSEALQQVAEGNLSASGLQQVIEVAASGWNRELKEVDLSKIGPKSTVSYHVLDYKSEVPVSLLRGVSLGQYEDNSWTPPDSTAYGRLNLEETPVLAAAEADTVLEIKTRTAQTLLYTAYHPAYISVGAAAVDDAYLRNAERQTYYAVGFSADTAGNTVPQSYETYVYATYLQIPEDLRESLQEIAVQAGLGADAGAVASYVRNCAVYDLQTPRVPDGEDFVLYFLQQSKRGYCVHFATAAAMLLRTVGIPARYVTGYSVSGVPGQWNEVTEEDAHAWVEYYVSGLGWLPLEVTPADTQEEPTEGNAPPQASELPQDAETEEPSEGTARPVSGEPASDPQPKMNSKLLLLLLLPVPLVFVRRWAGMHYRRDRCGKGNPNRRALALWQWLVQLSEAADMPIPEDLLCLAEKAKYSQHSMEETELQQLQQAVNLRIMQLETMPAAKRLWHRYGLILY